MSELEEVVKRKKVIEKEIALVLESFCNHYCIDDLDVTIQRHRVLNDCDTVLSSYFNVSISVKL